MDLQASLTPQEVSELLKITKNTVYELIKRGELPSYKIGKKIRCPKPRNSCSNSPNRLLPDSKVL